ncbi:MAG: hypothetical protein ABID79_02460 [Elusimicrobiota bacterium]
MGKKLIIFFVVVLIGVYFLADYFKKLSNISQKTTQLIKTPIEKALEIAKTENLIILRDAIGRYKYEKEKFPEVLEQLASSGYINRIPEGNWKYDAATGKIE